MESVSSSLHPPERSTLTTTISPRTSPAITPTGLVISTALQASFAPLTQTKLASNGSDVSGGAGAMPDGYIPPNITPKCTWKLGKQNVECPHTF